MHSPRTGDPKTDEILRYVEAFLFASPKKYHHLTIQELLVQLVDGGFGKSEQEREQKRQVVEEARELSAKLEQVLAWATADPSTPIDLAIQNGLAKYLPDDVAFACSRTVENFKAREAHFSSRDDIYLSGEAVPDEWQSCVYLKALNPFTAPGNAAMARQRTPEEFAALIPKKMEQHGKYGIQLSSLDAGAILMRRD